MCDLGQYLNSNLLSLFLRKNLSHRETTTNKNPSNEPGIVAHAFNPRTQDAEYVISEFEVSLVYIRIEFQDGQGCTEKLS